MIGRLVNFEGTPTALSELERVLVGECADALRALPGLHALHMMVDREAGRAIVLAIWKDAGCADRAMDAMVPIRRTIIGGGLRQSMSDYEVVV
ncbi:MAG: hypothetical protein BGN94_01950 [Rhizobiales bacterium 68-8]|nr:MAG: hypothetical protein BGN94_01950 [Rhizobiales bacterium 68-8]